MEYFNYGRIAAGVTVGVAVVSAVPFIAGALVPIAMSTFGTVISGVGTIHAVGGVAATLQTVSTVSGLTAAAVGASAGGAAGYAAS